MNHHVFGYGSLISEDSRSRTGITNAAIPVRMLDVKRGWYLPAPAYHLTGVGAIHQVGKTCNGVLFQVSNEELAKFDEREIPYGYSRIRVNSDKIIPLVEKVPEFGENWIYLTDHPGTPTRECPIAQSYVDVLLTGCLEFGEKFVREFISTTSGWNNPWINDRDSPKYLRSILTPDTRTIDSYLKKFLSKEFSRRK